MHGQGKRKSAEHRRSPSNVARSVLQDGVPQRRCDAKSVPPANGGIGLEKPAVGAPAAAAVDEVRAVPMADRAKAPLPRRVGDLDLIGAYVLLFPTSHLGVILPLGLYFQLVRVPAIHLKATDVSDAYKDAIARFLGDNAPHGVEVTSRLEMGDPARVVCDYAQKSGHDLVVMGTHGRTGLSRVLAGSVAENIVRHCAVPVLTVRDRKSVV